LFKTTKIDIGYDVCRYNTIIWITCISQLYCIITIIALCENWINSSLKKKKYNNKNELLNGNIQYILLVYNIFYLITFCNYIFLAELANIVISKLDNYIPTYNVHIIVYVYLSICNILYSYKWTYCLKRIPTNTLSLSSFITHLMIVK